MTIAKEDKCKKAINMPSPKVIVTSLLLGLFSCVIALFISGMISEKKEVSYSESFLNSCNKKGGVSIKINTIKDPHQYICLDKNMIINMDGFKSTLNKE